jgi:hypothetical protein
VGISRNAVLLTTFALAVAAAAPVGTKASAHAVGGTIVGTVTTKEPAPKPIHVTIDPAVCGASLPDESIKVDGAGHLANAVITVTGVKSPAPAEAMVSNSTCAFVPRVSLIKPAGAIKVTSKDPVLHTTHAAAADGKVLFNLALPIPNMVISRPADKPGVVELACNTHTWMRGYLFVTDELSAISAADGTFKLDGVPAGDHEIRIWHESLKSAPVKVNVKDGATVTAAFTLVK